MSGQGWLCGVCNQAQASCFCYCGGRESFLCETCFPVHYAKNPRLVHLAIPISAYGQHRIPGYFDRLQARSMNIPTAQAEILKNIDEVDKCIAEVSGEIQKVLNAVWEYGNKIITQLQQTKADLQRDIYASISDVESTMHEDAPILTNKWSAQLREFKGDISVFQHFVYSINSSSVIQPLQSMLTIQTSSPEINYTKLPGIHGNTLRVFDLVSGCTTTSQLSKKFDKRIRVCFITIDQIICVGGQPASTNAYIIQLSIAQVTAVASTRVARGSPGMIKVDNFVYVFGGGVTSCEKFNILDSKWSSLPDTQHPKSCFSPCEHMRDIYLLDIQYPIEVFHLLSQTFETLFVDRNVSSDNSIAINNNGEIVILTCHSQIGRWRPGMNSISVTSFTNQGEPPNSQCPPVLLGREIFFVRWQSGNLNVFNLDTNTLTTR